MFGLNIVSMKAQLIAVGIIAATSALSGHTVTKWYYQSRHAKELQAEIDAKAAWIKWGEEKSAKLEKQLAAQRRKFQKSIPEVSHEVNSNDVYRMQLPDSGVRLFNEASGDINPTSKPDARHWPFNPTRTESDSR